MPTSWRSLLAPACGQCRSWMDSPCRHVSQQECRHTPATVTPLLEVVGETCRNDRFGFVVGSAGGHRATSCVRGVRTMQEHWGPMPTPLSGDVHQGTPGRSSKEIRRWDPHRASEGKDGSVATRTGLLGASTPGPDHARCHRCGQGPPPRPLQRTQGRPTLRKGANPWPGGGRSQRPALVRGRTWRLFRGFGSWSRLDQSRYQWAD